MPANMKLYPANWKEIRKRILARAGNRCEKCGAANYEPHPVTGSKVVLTIAHIHNPDPLDVRDENLAAYCQRCHNRLDAPMRTQHRKATISRKKREAAKEAGQEEMFT